MGTGEPDTSYETTSSDTLSRFPRLELPPVPNFGGAWKLDETMPLLDEPAGTWQPPVLPAFDPELQYRVMVEHVAALSPHLAAAPVAPAPIADPEPDPVGDVRPPRRVRAVPESAPMPVMPKLEPAPAFVPLATSMVAVVIMLVVAGLLVWASRMSFSPSLMAFSGLLLAQLAGTAAQSPRGGRLPLLAGVPAIALALVALKGALGGFSDMAMVAGLFVIVAGVPTLLVLGVLQFVLHRRASRASVAESALRDGWTLRFGALLAIIGAAVMVRDSFSARPDAFVTFAVVALVAVTLAPVLRGREAIG